MATQELAPKERSLFTQVVKHYESKQYKKGLKLAEQILRRKPDHGDTVAMKALIINGQGNTEEAFALAKIALKHSMKSHICWHVYGLLYRSNKNFEEAIKAYKFALKLEPESQQIQRDLALLQMQMRDYPGYLQSRRNILQSRTGWRQNWTGLAVAQHLCGDLWAAEKTLTTYEETLRQPPPRTDVEHAEALVYKNTIIAETGEIERALQHLQEIESSSLDRTWVLEKKAEYLEKLGRNADAELVYRQLLKRNSELRSYYSGLMAAMGIAEDDADSKKKLCEEIAEANPRGDAAKRIQLDFLAGDDFRRAMEEYMRRMLSKGVPSLFANIKALYSDRDKLGTIVSVAEVLVDKEKEPTPQSHENDSEQANLRQTFTSSLHYFLAQHYNYYRCRDFGKAQKHVEEAEKIAPGSVDYRMCQARIAKHTGDLRRAAKLMEEARLLDTRDRYINTKSAKYHLRNNDIDAALTNMAMFTRADATGGALGDLLDMQCQWYLYEDAMAHQRRGELGLTLKRFQSIYDIFELWQEDQFDFHSFSLKKGQIRAYIDMVRWENGLRQHPFYARAALAAAEIYIRLHDDPHLAHPLSNGMNGDGLDAAARKKAQKKARKEQERQAKDEAEKKASKPVPSVDQNGEPKKVDQDPQGEQLLSTSAPLDQAKKFLLPLLDLSPKHIEAQHLAFDLFVRQNKWLLALRSLIASHKLDPHHPDTHRQLINLRHRSNQISSTLSPQAYEIFESELSAILPSDTDLKKYNDEYLQQSNNNAAASQAAILVRAKILNPEKMEEHAQDMIRTLGLEDLQLESAVKGQQILRDLRAPAKYIDDYRRAARARFPEANAFEESK